MDSSQRVSVVVPCRNEASRVEALLDAVRAQDAPICDVIVVEGQSTDGTREVLRQYAARHSDCPLKVLTQANGGIPASVNQGIRAATGDVIARLDAHCVPDPQYVPRALMALRETGAGVVGGRWAIEPGGATLIAKAISVAVAHPMGAGDAAYRVGGSGVAERRETDTVPFGCFRKALWERLGGFNERLLANEDYEFNYRARRAGFAVVLDSAVRSTYYARSTLGQLWRQYFRYGWWKAQMLRRFPGSLRWRQAVPAVFVAVLLVLLAAVVAGAASRSWLAGLALTYLAALLVAAAHASARSGAWRVLFVLPLAFTVIHMAWGLGALVNVTTWGRWPR